MLSIIIPTLNEEEGIAKTLCSIPKKIKKRAEIIVVDASTDSTSIIAKKFGAKAIQTKVKGKGRQIRKGIKESHGDILVFLDGDGSHPGFYIPKMLEKLKKANLVLACPGLKEFSNEDKTPKQIFKFCKLWVRPLFALVGFKASDPLSGFRAIRRKDWDRLNLTSNGFEIETEMNIKAVKQGFLIKEIAIPHLERCGGFWNSKLARNPESWFKILRVILKHYKDDKLKAKIKDWQAELKTNLKI